MFYENKVQQGSQNIALVLTFQFSYTKYKICIGEETLTLTASLALSRATYLFIYGTPILGKGNLTAPFQTSRDPSPDSYI